MLTPKERFKQTLERKPTPGHVPTFELVFYLTMEAFGRVHPTHRHFHQWHQMSAEEKHAQRYDVVDLYLTTAERYGHDAVPIYPVRGEFDEIVRTLELARERSKGEYFLLYPSDPTLEVPQGENMMELTVQLYERPEELHEISKRCLEESLEFAAKIKPYGVIDGFTMCKDYCFNTNPFFSPAQFEEMIAPYLKECISAFREHGFYTIKHTDGNVMPIMDMIVDCKPDAVHSLDPQGGVSLDAVMKKYGDRVCLIGNVNCGLLQTGTDEEAAADVRRALRDGMQRGGGYIFSTSNCAYTGLPLKRYEMMNEIWRNEGIYS